MHLAFTHYSDDDECPSVSDFKRLRSRCRDRHLLRKRTRNFACFEHAHTLSTGMVDMETLVIDSVERTWKSLPKREQRAMEQVDEAAKADEQFEADMSGRCMSRRRRRHLRQKRARQLKEAQVVVEEKEGVPQEAVEVEVETGKAEYLAGLRDQAWAALGVEPRWVGKQCALPRRVWHAARDCARAREWVGHDRLERRKARDLRQQYRRPTSGYNRPWGLQETAAKVRHGNRTSVGNLSGAKEQQVVEEYDVVAVLVTERVQRPCRIDRARAIRVSTRFARSLPSRRTLLKQLLSGVCPFDAHTVRKLLSAAFTPGSSSALPRVLPKLEPSAKFGLGLQPSSASVVVPVEKSADLKVDDGKDEDDHAAKEDSSMKTTCSVEEVLDRFAFNFFLVNRTAFGVGESRVVQSGYSSYMVRSMFAKYRSLPHEVCGRFLRHASRAHSDSIKLAFHGTSSDAMDSIFRQGFKIGGVDVPVRHGTVHGKGVYAATDLGMPLGYSARAGGSRSVIVCAVVYNSSMDTNPGGFYVIRDKERVLPLFQLNA